MAQKMTSAFCLASCLFLASCGRVADGSFGVLAGTLAWSRQDWALAASSFLDVTAAARASGNSRMEAYAVYGLASTYLAQDEYDSSIARLSSLGTDLPKEIRSGMWYQAGIIASRKGEYDKAISFFRASLENDPSCLDAKINLELSRRSLEEHQSARSAGAPDAFEERKSSAETETIFNVVRRKEQERWKNQEQAASRPAVADY